MAASFIQRDIPPLLERFELKYQIPMEMVAPISKFVSVYCRLDRHSQEAPGGYYPVVSLYLDSPAYTFLERRRQGAEKRFNMRIRSYGSPSGIPCYFEIKQKTGQIVKKFRAAVQDQRWPAMLTSPGADWNQETGWGNDNLRLFCSLALSYNTTPKVLTQYLRKAYVSEVDDYARVTFDRELKFQPRDTYKVVVDESEMIHHDHEACFEPGTSVILELKCPTRSVPLWMLDLIRCFDLKQGSFSKYAAGMEAVFQMCAAVTGYRIPATAFVYET